MLLGMKMICGLYTMWDAKVINHTFRKILLSAKAYIQSE